MVNRKGFTLYIQVEVSGNPLRASAGRGKPHRIKMKRKVDNKYGKDRNRKSPFFSFADIRSVKQKTCQMHNPDIKLEKHETFKKFTYVDRRAI